VKASSIYRNQRGISSLIFLLVVSLTAVVIFQINALYKNSTTQGPKSSPAPIATTQPLAVQPKNPEELKKYLIAEAALLGVSDNVSLYFKDLQQNSEVSLEPTKAWIPASTIKAYVLLEAFRQKRLSLIDFNQEITITADNTVSTELETDEFPRLKEGTKATIRQLVEAMITQSDNTAYNTLLDILDRRNINAALKSIGITETVVGEKLNLDGGQFQQDLGVPGRQPNTTTVKDYATFFSALYTHQIPHAEEILSILKRQKINDMIPAKLPDNTVIAHKTGEWAPIYHDGGIVYKPSDPFVFVVFTNSGDPAIVAKLAQVAYFQDPKYVGKSLAALPSPQKKNLAFLNRPTYYTDQTDQVLGTNTGSKFPQVTAEDLGITSKDLAPDTRQINNVQSALVTPGSLLYSLKKTLENTQLTLSFNNSQKAKAYLNLANGRLSEIKSTLSRGEVKNTDQLLSQAVDNIKNAIDLAKNDPQKDTLLIEIKKTYDLYYAVMSDKAANVPDEQKAQFVDSVYNFYQKGKSEISPVINSSVIVNPTQQKPTVGVIDKVSSTQMILKFDDGSTKQVNLTTGTNVRAVDQETSQDTNALKVGTKVAVLGPTSDNSNTINAQFVLNNIPQGLTDQHQGTVTVVDPNQGVIKVIDQKGQVNIVKVDSNTTVKSKDTNVSLEGIKTGSQVVVFGITGSQVSTGSATPTITSNSSSQKAASASGNTGNTVKSQDNQNQVTVKPSPFVSTVPVPANKATTPVISAVPTQVPAKPTVEIKATSVTVVGNSSGKTEQTQTQPAAKPAAQPTSAPVQPASQPAKTPPAAPPPAPTTAPSKSSDDKKDSKK